MALEHASSGEPIDVRPLGAQLAERKTTALFKARDLEVIRLVLPQGGELPPHRVPGEITIHCIEGALDITLDAEVRSLAAGELMFLAGGEVHAVRATSPSSALVTIALRI
jgi:quercetin dioxygenase-like cupin family protein